MGERNEPVLIGIDIGTTNLKFIATEKGGKIVGVVRYPMITNRPAHGVANFDLDLVKKHLFQGLKQLVAELPSGMVGRVAAIGVTSVGESFVGLNGKGEVITPCPSWLDRRSANYRERLGLNLPDWFNITGMVDDDIYTVHRLIWWYEHEADLAKQVRHWLMVADYVVFLLTGAFVASPSLAARSGMADRNNGQWSQQILDAAGLQLDYLPVLQPSASIAGYVSAEVARLIGLPSGLPVTNAGHDHPCAMLGCGLIHPGGMMDSIGTSEALKIVVDEPLDYHQTHQGSYDCYPHAIAGCYNLSGYTPSSGGFLSWLMRLVGADIKDEKLWQAAAHVPAGGTGTPWNQRIRRGMMDFLDVESDAPILLRAAIEALATWLHINVDDFKAMANIHPSQLIVIGGGSKNLLSNRIKAAMTGVPCSIPNIQEAAGIGAALAGGIAAGVFQTPAQAAELPDITWQQIPTETEFATQYHDLLPSLTDFLNHAASQPTKN